MGAQLVVEGDLSILCELKPKMNNEHPIPMRKSSAKLLIKQDTDMDGLLFMDNKKVLRGILPHEHGALVYMMDSRYMSYIFIYYFTS